MLLQCRSSACSLPLRSQMLQTSPHHKSKRRKTRHSLLYLINFCGSTIKITSPRAVLLEEVNQLAHNKVLVAAGVSAAIGQLSKPFTAVFINGKEFDYKAAFQAGGFPSTHSSVVVTLISPLQKKSRVSSRVSTSVGRNRTLSLRFRRLFRCRRISLLNAHFPRRGPQPNGQLRPYASTGSHFSIPGLPNITCTSAKSVTRWAIRP